MLLVYRSYHRQHRLLLDPSVLSDMEQRHQKDTEHQVKDFWFLCCPCFHFVYSVRDL